MCTRNGELVWVMVGLVHLFAAVFRVYSIRFPRWLYALLVGFGWPHLPPGPPLFPFAFLLLFCLRQSDSFEEWNY